MNLTHEHNASDKILPENHIEWETIVLTFTAEQTGLTQREEDAIVRRTGAEDAAQQGNGTQLCVKSRVRAPAPHQEGETALK